MPDQPQPVWRQHTLRLHTPEGGTIEIRLAAPEYELDVPEGIEVEFVAEDQVTPTSLNEVDPGVER